MPGSSDGRRWPAALTTVLALALVLTLVAASVAGQAAVAAPSAGTGAPTGEQVLDRVAQRYGEADTVAGRATVRTTNDSGTEVANVSFAVARPASTRVVVERDGETFRWGTNGTVSWAVGPRGTAVWDAASPAGGPDGGLPVSVPSGPAGLPTGQDGVVPGGVGGLALAVPTGLDAANATATLVDTTTVDGSEAYELRVESARPVGNAGDDEGAGAGDVTTTLWVATDDYRVLRTETTGGERTTVVDVEQVRFDVSIDESTFRPPGDRAPASSFERFDTFAAAQAGTTLALPSLEGGTFTDATVSVQGGETVVVQRYALDGENATVVSTTATERFDALAENATAVSVDGRDAFATEVRDGSIVFWTEDGVTTAVAVEGSTERALEVARMLRL